MRFDGKIALITACASGIGRATADIMAREGATIVGVDNNQERLDKTVAEITAAGGKAHGRLCDALQKDQVDPLVEGVAKEFGGIDILVNAVGGSTIIPRSSATVDELTLDEWKQLIDFNLDGTFLFTHAVVPIMKRQQSGKIVNLASIAGRGRSASSSAAYAGGQGRDHRLYQEDFVRGRPLRHQHQCDRAEHDADRAHPTALGAAQPGGPGAGDRRDPAAPRRRGGRSGQGDLFSRVERCGFHHRRDDRRHGWELNAPRPPERSRRAGRISY
jgi:hypothetical protein